MKTRKPQSTPASLRSLHVNEGRWRAILASSPDAIISIDLNGIVTLFNPTAERMFGYAAEDVIGRDVAMLMPAPYNVEHGGYIRRYQQTGEAKAIGRVRHVQARRRSGEVFPIELSVSEASTAGEEPVYVAIIRDVTERLSAEAELREAQQQARRRDRLADIGAITAKLVHDLGNPLAAVSMQAQLLLRRARRGDIGPSEMVEVPAEQLLATVHRLESLVREFNGFARDQRVVLREVDLSLVLRGIVEIWTPLAAARSIDLVRVEAETGTTVRVDEDKLRRVLDNLIGNALEAIGQGPGMVVLRVGIPSPEKIRVSVEDDGPGIPEDLDVFRLFETTKPEGTGIGLAVAKQIVLAHGGTIEHTMRSPNGAIFHVDLPRTGAGPKD